MEAQLRKLPVTLHLERVTGDNAVRAAVSSAQANDPEIAIPTCKVEQAVLNRPISPVATHDPEASLRDVEAAIRSQVRGIRFQRHGNLLKVTREPS